MGELFFLYLLEQFQAVGLDDAVVNAAISRLGLAVNLKIAAFPGGDQFT